MRLAVRTQMRIAQRGSIPIAWSLAAYAIADPGVPLNVNAGERCDSSSPAFVSGFLATANPTMQVPPSHDWWWPDVPIQIKAFPGRTVGAMIP
jgi:hypothetical protein